MGDEARIRDIEQRLKDAGIEIEGLAQVIFEAVKKEAELSRRQLMTKTQAAFREGFLTGKRWPKFAPWANDIWRQSDFYKRHFSEKGRTPELESRYARYNELT